jgi:predicted PurR-regulated permease PerM
MNDPAPVLSLRDRAGNIIATGTILAILYFARDVLIPITLAVILSLLISPLVRALRRFGMGSASSVLLAVLALAVLIATLAGVLGVQVVRMSASLPQYEATIRDKFSTLNEMSVGRFSKFTGRAERIIDERIDQPAAATTEPTRPSPDEPALPKATAPITVEVHQPPASPLHVMEKVLSSLWVPLETAGIVLVVLVFVLLEHEALRDRFIRIAGGTDLRTTTLALNDAGERLSRFFVSQFAVNLGVGTALWIGLALIGLPHALLWGALGAVLRFVPYVGVWIAALLSTILAAAVDPGWSLAVATLSLFVIVELIAGQLVEPQLYGHTTGMSPLSVVIAATFWTWLWGPIGLIVSTPLTLCLVVAGRHIRALSLLDVLLGDAHALTMPQRFYQRALSGDSDEVIASARDFLKRHSFAAYCDMVVMPALQLARLDVISGAISGDQLRKVRDAMVAVIAAIGGSGGKFTWRHRPVSVLDRTSVGPGRVLREQRERLTGRWQGPLIVPPGSVMLCVSLGSISDDLATELLVRILRDQKLDARHLSLDDLHQSPPPEATPGGVSMVYLVSAFPSEERKRAESVAQEIRSRFPNACLLTVFLPGMLLQPGSAIDSVRGADRAAASFGEAVQICLDLLQERDKLDVKRAS